MGKTISYRGIIAEGLQERIRLSTLKGKRGYKITKFQTLMSTPGVTGYENTMKIYSKEQTAVSTSVNFTEGDLLAASYIEDDANHAYPISNIVIFDNEVFNQDIYVTSANETGTVPVNYYIELETVELSDIQATQLTLKSLRSISE